jgi:hypothetical protein
LRREDESMKRIAAALLLIGALLSQHIIYPDVMIVVDLDRENDLVTVETSTGHDFQFRGCEDWMIGDLAGVLMYSNMTDDVRDDQVLRAQYSGFNEFQPMSTLYRR